MVSGGFLSFRRRAGRRHGAGRQGSDIIPAPDLIWSGPRNGHYFRPLLFTTTRLIYKRVFLSVGLLLMFLNIYKTGSRGPWIATIITFVFFLFLAHNKLRRYLVVLGALTVLVMLIRPGVWDTIANMYYGTVIQSHP